MASASNHYEVLGIGPQATAEEVERAYRFTLELYGDGALATYSLLDPGEVRRARARVQEAYEVLRDPARRQAYDVSQGLSGAPSRPAPSNVRTWPQPASRPASAAAAAGPVSGQGETAAEPGRGTEGAPVPASPPTGVGATSVGAVLPPSLSATDALPGPAASSVGAPPVPAAPARAAVSVPGHPRTPHVLPEPVTGAILRRYREERGVSLREIANQSKIGTRYLEYIEGDRHDMLPAAVYLRGFLQEYARALGLDPRLTANAYMAQFPRPWPQE